MKKETATKPKHPAVVGVTAAEHDMLENIQTSRLPFSYLSAKATETANALIEKGLAERCTASDRGGEKPYVLNALTSSEVGRQYLRAMHTTLDDVKANVARIREVASYDPEQATSLERDVHNTALLAIAVRVQQQDLRDLAIAAGSTATIEFRRG